MKIVINMKLSKMFIPVIVLIAIIANSCGQENSRQDSTGPDWPQYLGPNRNSTSDQKGILRSWPKNGPEVLWTVNLGTGFGGAVVKDRKVYLLDRDDEVGDILRCFDIVSGKELWNFSYGAPGTVRFHGSRSVPAVDGNYIYSCGHNGDLYCIDINTQKPVWNKNIWTDYGGDRIPTWAISQSPLVYGDLLIVASQAPQAGVVAYNKLTGNVKWKTPSLGLIGYVSPAIVKIDGEDHIVMVTASGRGSSGNPDGPPPGVSPQDAPGQDPPSQVGTDDMGKIVGIRPLTGEILWEYTNWECHIPVPSAVDAGEGRVLVAGGYELGTVMLKVKRETDDTYSIKELFRHNDFGEHTKPPLLHNGYFYGQFSTNSKRDGLVCMSMDGKIMWKTMRKPSFDKGSMILADGLILATNGSTTLYLIEPDPSGFKPLASAELLAAKPGDENEAARFATQNWAPLALAEGKLFIRDQSRLLCVKVAR